MAATHPNHPTRPPRTQHLPGLPFGPEPITGRHVTLTRLTESHFPSLWTNVGSHDETFTWWPVGPYTNSTDFETPIKEILLISRLAVYAIIPHSGPHANQAVGLGFIQYEEPLSNRVSELGALFGPHLQRSRASTEAIYLLCFQLFEKLNYRRMAWKTNSLNEASRKAAERYGLVYEGTFRQDSIIEGRNRDTAWYSMIDSEWPVCRRTFEIWLGDGNFDEEGRQRRGLVEIRESLKRDGKLD